jgi:hypothetical protein
MWSDQIECGHAFVEKESDLHNVGAYGNSTHSQTSPDQRLDLATATLAIQDLVLPAGYGGDGENNEVGPLRGLPPRWILL